MIWAAAAWSAEPVRLAVVISSDVGAAHEAPLAYADQDGKRVADVRSQLGGYAPGDVWVVPAATVDRVTQALSRVTVRASDIRAAGREASLLVYYAGHAGADGLHLGGELLPLGALKLAARVVPASERIFVVDACQSGQIARSRGASLVAVADAPSGFVAPSDEAWFTSSGPEENSFEVEDRRGALFTHYFIAGSRGAADVDGNNRVSLGELYSYASSHTAEAAAGIGLVQQPRWSGDLAAFTLTDLARSATGVRVVGPVATPLWVVDRRSGLVAAEIPAGAGASIALPAGHYQVIGRPDAGGMLVAEVDVAGGWSLWEPAQSLKTSRGVRTRGGLVDTRPLTFGGGYRFALENGSGRVDGHGGWLGVEASSGRGWHVGAIATAARMPFQGEWWQGTDTWVDGRLTARLDLTDGPIGLGAGVAVGGGWSVQQTQRAPHPD
jgi:hypothetical protein